MLFHFLPKLTLTTVTHFEPLDLPPEATFMSKTSILLKEFDTFPAWLASGAPLGSLGSFLGSSLDLSGWTSGLGSFLGAFLDASGPVSVFFQSFWTSHGNISLSFKHDFYLTDFFFHIRLSVYHVSFLCCRM